MIGFEPWLAFVAAMALAAAPPLWALWPARGRGGRGDAALLAAALGLPLWSLCAHVVFLAGVPVTLAGAAAAYALLWALCAALRAAASRATATLPGLPSAQKLVLYHCAAFLAFMLVALSSGTTPFYDALAYWVAKGWTFVQARDARVFATTLMPTYPLALPFVNSLFLLIGDSVGVVSWQRAFLYLAALYGLLSLARRHGMPGLLAGAAIVPAAILTIDQGGVGNGLYADGTLGAALMLAAILMMETLEGRSSRAWPAGAALAFAALTKINTLAYLPILAVAYGAALLGASAIGSRRDRLALFMAVFVPPVGALVAWKSLLWAIVPDSGIEGMGRQVFVGDILASGAPFAVYFHKLGLAISAMAETFSLREPWSLAFHARLGWAFVLPFVALPFWRGLAPGERFAVVASAGLVALVVGVIFSLVPANDDSEADYWFRTGIYRSAVHVLPVCVVAAQALLARLAASAIPSREQAVAPGEAEGARAARQRLFLYAVPILLAAALLSQRKGSSNWFLVFKSYGESRRAVAAFDRYGLHEPETRGGERVRWTSASVRLPFLKRGDRLKIRYNIERPDLTAERPVEVTVAIAGLPPERTSHASPALKELEFDVSSVPGPYLELQVSVSRLWTTPDRRACGVALHAFEWPGAK